MRWFPRTVGQAYERVRLLRLSGEACIDQERWQCGERHSGTQRFMGAEGTVERVLPVRSLACEAPFRRRQLW